jgi:hypothetical protein
MLIVFFDSQGVVHKEYIPEGKTVNAESYKGVIVRFLKRIQRVRPAAFCSGLHFADVDEIQEAVTDEL